MKLSELKRQQDSVPYLDGELVVYALTLEQIIDIIDSYPKQINALFNGDAAFDDIIRQAPNLAAMMIAVSTGEPEAIQQAKELPVGVQLIALEKIWVLTIPDQDSLGKMLAALAKGIQKLRDNPVYAKLAQEAKKNL